MCSGSTGVIAYRTSSVGDTFLSTIGETNGIPCPADFDGDGQADLATFDRDNGHFDVLESGSGRAWSSPASAPGGLPAVGDYDGDGRADCAWRRPATQDFHALLTGDDAPSNWGSIVIGPFGSTNDWPLPAPLSTR